MGDHARTGRNWEGLVLDRRRTKAQTAPYHTMRVINRQRAEEEQTQTQDRGEGTWLQMSTVFQVGIKTDQSSARQNGLRASDLAPNAKMGTKY